MTCECEHEFHQSKPCTNNAAEHPGVITSPNLCLPCLYGCEE